MATHSSILAWRIPWTEEPGGLHSMGSQRVRHEWASEHTGVVRTLWFHCWGYRFNPWVGNSDPASHTAPPKNKHTQLMATLFWKWEHNVKSSVVNSQTPWQPVDYNPEVVLQSICKMFTAVLNATVGSIFSSPSSSISCQPRSPIHFIS